MHIHTVSSLDEFVGFPGEPEGFPASVADLWSSGRSGPDFCFVARAGGERLGRIGFRVEHTLPEHVGAELDSLPEQEVFAYGLELPWQGDWRGTGDPLLETALGWAKQELPDDPQLRINAETHSHVERRRAMVEEAGFLLFQEKEGVLWSDSGRPVRVPARLRYFTMAEIGSEPVVELVSSVAAETLDRNDRHYSSHMSSEDWARVYVSLFERPELTVLGFVEDEPVGFAAVSPFDEGATATITFIGVAPEHRGNGFVDDLLLEATARAAGAGFRRILSDVDVENLPMLAAMERCGHRAKDTPWHVWHYRAKRV